MKKILLFAISSVVLSGSMMSCSDDDNDNNSIVLDGKCTMIPVTSNDLDIIENNNKFAFNLLKAVNEKSVDNSRLVMSPMSVSMSLSMLANGAEGDTYTEIADALGCSGFSIEEMNALNTKLIDNLPVVDKAAKVTIANSLWLDNDFVAEDAFAEEISSSYYAGIFSCDFADSKTLDAINRWCSNATNGKISNFLRQLHSETRMLLVNTLYFKAPWTTTFKNEFVGKFTAEDGSLQDVKYMNGTVDARCYSHDKFYTAEFSYANNAYNYTIVLPEEGVSVDECIDELAAGGLYNGSLSFVGISNMTLTMPVYEMEFKMLAKESLEALGIKKAFDSSVGLPAIGKGVVLGDVVHVCNFNVDKNGTEAAAATAAIMYDSSLSNFKSELVVDRPFLFFVKEVSTGAILFIGKVGKI